MPGRAGGTLWTEELRRCRAITVAEGAEEAVELRFVLGRGQLTIGLQPEPLVTDVRARDEVIERQIEVELRRRQHVLDEIFVAATADPLHGVAEHLNVHLEADGGDRAMLLGTEQVAGAADLQVAERDLEAHAQLVQARHHVQSLVGVLGQRARRVEEQVAIGPLARAADPTAELVEL